MMTTNYNEKNDVDSAHVVGSVNGMLNGIHKNIYLPGSGALSQVNSGRMFYAQGYKASTAPEIRDLMDAAREGFHAAVCDRRDKNGDPVVKEPTVEQVEKHFANEPMRPSAEACKSRNEMYEQYCRDEDAKEALRDAKIVEQFNNLSLFVRLFERTANGYRVEFK